ncbi:MAG: nitrilase-related carbon-nitrogen hydrolase, partial [Chloroflexota bacterium]
MRTLRLAMAQINSTVGDLEANARRICDAVDEARDLGANLVAFPEMALPGYPVEDLLLKPQFVDANLTHLRRIAGHCRSITAVVGFIDKTTDIYNAAAIIHDGEVAGVYHKQYLPNYGVFDENRYFRAGSESPVYVIDGVRVGVNICEDIWHPVGPTALQALADAEVIVNINASPYHAGKWRFREQMLATRASDYGVVLSYTNLVGGQDELVFDGGSVIFDERGEPLARGRRFQEDLVVADIDVESVFRTRIHDPRRRQERHSAPMGQHVPVHHVSEWLGAPRPPLPVREPVAPLDLAPEVYQALVLGLGDYVRKSGFRKVALGLSGGIDSSITATIAVDALGKDNVMGVAMPSRYSSEGSLVDARLMAENLGISFQVISTPSLAGDRHELS